MLVCLLPSLLFSSLHSLLCPPPTCLGFYELSAMSVIKLGLWCTFISICQSPSSAKSVSCAPSISTSASAHFHFPFRPLAIGSLISIVSVARAANKMSRCGHDKHLLAALLSAWLRCPVCWKSYWFSAVAEQPGQRTLV